MTRTMVDFTHDAVSIVRREVPSPQMVGWYSTGSPDVRWTDADRAEFQGAIMVDIDQGFTGSPVPTANVRDVETGAWGPGTAVNRAGWLAERPTIYCDRSTLPSVIADGWRGDVWLSWPGYDGVAPPLFPGVTVVAVQNVIGRDYDTSVVYDPYWPAKAPVTMTPEIVNVAVHTRAANVSFNRVDGAAHYVIEFRASLNAVNTLVARAPQTSQASLVYVANLTIPGAQGGIIDVYAIIGSNPALIGSHNLP